MVSSGALVGTAVILNVLAFRHARNLRNYDPAAPGFVDTSFRYRRIRAGAWALAVSSGLALLTTVGSRTWFDRPGARWGAGAAGAASALAGAVLLLRSPPRIGSSTLTAPHRALGALLISVGVPLSTAPLTVRLHSRRGRGGSMQLGVGVAGLGLLVDLAY